MRFGNRWSAGDNSSLAEGRAGLSQVKSPTGFTPLGLAGWQCGGVLAAAAICGAFAPDGVAAFASALVGGASVALPRLAFAVRLFILLRRVGRIEPMRFLVGEFVKVASSVLLLCCAVVLAQRCGWLVGGWWALMVGVVVALKIDLVVLIVRSRRRHRPYPD